MIVSVIVFLFYQEDQNLVRERLHSPPKNCVASCLLGKDAKTNTSGEKMAEGNFPQSLWRVHTSLHSCALHTLSYVPAHCVVSL